GLGRQEGSRGHADRYPEVGLSEALLAIPGGSRANLKLSPDQIHNYAVEKSASGKCMATERRLGSDLLEERFWITSGWPTTRPKRQRPRENLTFRRAPLATTSA